MLVPSPWPAQACSPADPALARTYPAAGGVLPAGALLLLDGQVLRPEQLVGTVDGQPAQLVLVPEHSHSFQYWGWDQGYRTMALRVEPPPLPGQTIVITGDPCFQWEGFSYCDEVELVYTVGEADVEPPDAPADLWYDVYDHGMEATRHEPCAWNSSVRFELTIHTEIERSGLEYPLEYHLSRRPRDAPGEWTLVEHDWLRDAEAHDPWFQWLFSLADVESVLPLAEAYCLRLQTFDASDNLGGELEVCPPCHDELGPEEFSFIALWPDGSPSYDDEWLYPGGYCPAALEPEPEPGTSTGDEGFESSTSGALEPEPEPGSSSGDALPGGDLPDRGCACVATPAGRVGSSAGLLLGLLLLGAGRSSTARRRAS